MEYVQTRGPLLVETHSPCLLVVPVTVDTQGLRHCTDVGVDMEVHFDS